MKRTFLLSLLLAVGLSQGLAAEDAKSAVKAAAKRLADKANYSWTSTPQISGAGGGNFRPGPTEGQTEGGITYLKSSMGERSFETASKGDKILFKGEAGWQAPDPDGQGPGQFVTRRLRTFKAPAAEAADLADKAGALKDTDGVISGELTEEGAKSFLTFGRRPDSPAPKDAKGSVKFWLKDGGLSKYELKVSGKIIGREDNEIAIDRTTTVEIKNVGTTKLTLPEEATKKL